VEHYTFFYYTYYYYTYLAQKDAGASDTDAAAHAQKMAPVYAYEQLEYMLKKAPPAHGTQVPPTVATMPLAQPPQGPSAASMAADQRLPSQHPAFDLEQDVAMVRLQSLRSGDDSRAWEIALGAAAGAMQKTELLQATDGTRQATAGQRASTRWQRQRTALRGMLLSGGKDEMSH